MYSHTEWYGSGAILTYKVGVLARADVAHEHRLALFAIALGQRV